jgi:hypothetical protein
MQNGSAGVALSPADIDHFPCGPMEGLEAPLLMPEFKLSSRISDLTGDSTAQLSLQTGSMAVLWLVSQQKAIICCYMVTLHFGHKNFR